MQARVLTHPAFARRRFVEIAQTPDAALDLVEASLVIDVEDNPTIEISHYLAQVDDWSGAVRQRLEGSRDVERIVDAINRLLFDEEGFHGEDEDYYDPRSALLSETLDRHSGLPMTLSILYIEMSRRVGVEVSGVALPGRSGTSSAIRSTAGACSRPSSCSSSSTRSTAAVCACASTTSARSRRRR